MGPGHERKHVNGNDSEKPVCMMTAREWENHRTEGSSTLAKLSLSEDMIAQLAENTSSLKKLDQLDLIVQHLIGAATGKKQIPLMAHIVTVAFFGAIILLVIANNTQKTIRLNWGEGLVIENGQQVRVPPDKTIEIRPSE